MRSRQYPFVLQLGWVSVVVALFACHLTAGDPMCSLRAYAENGNADLGDDPSVVFLHSLGVVLESHDGFEADELVDILVLVGNREEGVSVQVGVIRGLASLARSSDLSIEGNALLISGLSSPSSIVRAAAAEVALTSVGGDARPGYRMIIESETSAPVLIAALRAYQEFPGPPGRDSGLLETLIHRADHQDPGVSYHARVLLGVLVHGEVRTVHSSQEWRAWWRRQLLDSDGEVGENPRPEQVVPADKGEP